MIGGNSSVGASADSLLHLVPASRSCYDPSNRLRRVFLAASGLASYALNVPRRGERFRRRRARCRVLRSSVVTPHYTVIRGVLATYFGNNFTDLSLRRSESDSPQTPAPVADGLPLRLWRRSGNLPGRNHAAHLAKFGTGGPRRLPDPAKCIRIRSVDDRARPGGPRVSDARRANDRPPRGRR